MLQTSSENALGTGLLLPYWHERERTHILPQRPGDPPSAKGRGAARQKGLRRTRSKETCQRREMDPLLGGLLSALLEALLKDKIRQQRAPRSVWSCFCGFRLEKFPRNPSGLCTPRLLLSLVSAFKSEKYLRRRYLCIYGLYLFISLGGKFQPLQDAPAKTLVATRGSAEPQSLSAGGF